jgi:hypothetical protein
MTSSAKERECDGRSEFAILCAVKAAAAAAEARSSVSIVGSDILVKVINWGSGGYEAWKGDETEGKYDAFAVVMNGPGKP